MKHRFFTHPKRSLPLPTTIPPIIVEDLQKKYRNHTLTIDSRDRNTSLYPNSENYVIDLLKPYKNITRIELIGSLVPKSGYTITKGFNDTLYIIKDPSNDLKNTVDTYQCEPNVILCKENTDREKNVDYYKSGKPSCDEGCFRTGNGITTSLMPKMIDVNKNNITKVIIPPGNYKHQNSLIIYPPPPEYGLGFYSASGLSVNTCPSSCGKQCSQWNEEPDNGYSTHYNEFAHVLSKSIKNCTEDENWDVKYSQYTGKYTIQNENKFAIINYNCAKAHGHYESRKDTQLTYEVIHNSKIIFGTKNKSEFLNHILSNKTEYFTVTSQPSCQDGTKILQLLTDHINFRYQNKIDKFSIVHGYSFRAYYRTHFYGNYERQYPPCSIAPTLGFKTLNVLSKEVTIPNPDPHDPTDPDPYEQYITVNAIETHLPANLDGEQYAMLTIPTFGRLTGQSRFMRKSFAIVELTEDFVDNTPYAAIKNFHPPLPKLDKLDIKFYRYDKKNQHTLYDFNGRDHLLVFRITTLL